MTLLNNVVKKLHQLGYRVDNVTSVIVDSKAYSWSEFSKVADFECTNEIKQDLAIVLIDGGWLERTNHLWDYHITPTAMWGSSALTKDMLIEREE